MIIDNNLLTNLDQSGIYTNFISSDIIDIINQKYFVNNSIKYKFLSNYNQYFYKIQSYDKFIKEIFYNKSIFNTLSIYRNKEIKLRDIHAVKTNPISSEKSILGHSVTWHTDFEYSIGFMLLLNNLTIKDTHMIFIKNQKHQHGLRLKTIENIEENNIVHCIGSAGQYFIFDNANYLHKAFISDTIVRKTLHAIYI